MNKNFVLLFTLIIFLSCGGINNNENKNDFKSDTITKSQNVNSVNFDRLYRKLKRLNNSIDEIEDSTDLLIFLESKKILYKEINKSGFYKDELELIKLLLMYDTLAVNKVKYSLK